MIVQWQLVDVETGKAIKVEGELELVGCEEFFDEGGTWPYSEARRFFGDIDSMRNPVGILSLKGEGR